MTGNVLISEPFTNDPNFKRSVVLIVDHGEDGTVGFILNQKTDFAVNVVMEPLRVVNESLYQGGPVELESFHYVHCFEDLEDSVEVGPGLYWSGNFEQLKDGLESGIYNQEDVRFFIGYSGWSFDQLEAEIENKSWILGHLDKDQIFNREIDDAELWKLAVKAVGGDDALLSNSPDMPWLN